MAIFHEATYHEDTITKRPITEAEIRFLKKLQHEMNTQDTVCQADPRFWQIISKDGVPTSPEYSDRTIIYDTDEGTVVSRSIDEAIQYLIDTIEGIDGYSYPEDKIPALFKVDGILTVRIPEHDVTIEIHDEEDIVAALNLLEGDDTYSVGYELEIEKHHADVLFLTKKAADEHLRKYGYNYPDDAHAYAHTAQRSPEIETLYKLLHEVDFDQLLDACRKGGLF